jgi:hypothetical protein
VTYGYEFILIIMKAREYSNACRTEGNMKKLWLRTLPFVVTVCDMCHLLLVLLIWQDRPVPTRKDAKRYLCPEQESNSWSQTVRDYCHRIVHRTFVSLPCFLLHPLSLWYSWRRKQDVVRHKYSSVSNRKIRHRLFSTVGKMWNYPCI